MFGRIVDVVDKILTFIESWTLFITVMIGLVSLFFNVVLRYGFNYSLSWSEEMIRLIIMYTTFIGCSAAVKNRNMITIDALPQMVPKLKIPLTFVSHAATLIFSVIIIVLGWQMSIQQYTTHQKTVYMEIPTFILYFMLPMMGVMMFLRVIQAIYVDINQIKLAKSAVAK